MVHILVNVSDLYILGGSVHTIKKYAKAFVVACKDNGLELNADKTKYMVMSRDEGAGRSNSLKLDNRSFEMVNQFKYKGKSLNDRNFIITFFYKSAYGNCLCLIFEHSPPSSQHTWSTFPEARGCPLEKAFFVAFNQICTASITLSSALPATQMFFHGLKQVKVHLRQFRTVWWMFQHLKFRST